MLTGSDLSQNKENFSKSKQCLFFVEFFFSIKWNCLIKKNLSLFSLNTTDNLILSQQTPRNKTLDPPEKTGQEKHQTFKSPMEELLLAGSSRF